MHRPTATIATAATEAQSSTAATQGLVVNK
jgi:hypothetical protein